MRFLKRSWELLFGAAMLVVAIPLYLICLLTVFIMALWGRVPKVSEPPMKTEA